MTAKFIHLRTHSSYSLAEGAIKIDELIALCLKHKMPALAVTDSGNMFCSLEFCKEASANGIQPIVGMIIGLNAGLGSKLPIIDKILLLAKCNIGYKNLLKLVSKAHIEQVAPLEPHITMEDLQANAEGLIALSGYDDGVVGRLIVNGDIAIAEQMLQKLSAIFKQSFYIELQRHGVEVEQLIEPVFIDLAYKYNLPLVATNNVYFANAKMYEAHDALLCIAAGKYVLDDNRRKFTPEYYFKSPREMEQLFKDIPEAIQNTIAIAKRCSVKSEERPPMLPKFQTESGRTQADELKILAEQGLEMRLEQQVFKTEHDEQARVGIRKQYFARLAFELNVIITMDFPGYFLIVSDFIKWSKRNDIPVGPGRGSGAGSVVAWSLEITDLDPIHFGLLFERFLNPDRISMPDFDIDFCQERRDEVIGYVRHKYGVDRVAQIITFGKLQAKAVIRDVGRVLQLPFNQIDKISKMIPFNPQSPVTLSQAIEMEPHLRKAAKEDEQIDKLLNIALQLEGLNRHSSTHAAGVVIAGQPLVELLPLTYDHKANSLVVQYSMKYAEAAGLVKFDFLGLKTLTVIANCCKLIKQNNITIDLAKIPLNDHATYQMLSKGSSIGVFQFESSGMRDALRNLKPDCIEDLIALGALYRPGPMDNIPTYIACKHGLSEPDYLHPSLEAILKETFGVIIYQEQVMQIAQILSSYTLAAADLLRRAMGKKIKAEMDDQREMFVSGAVKNGVDEKQASNIFDLVAKFAGYGFNKSHAAAYGMISYQTAYLKANFPVEFQIASMNLEIDDTDKISIFIQETKAMSITVLPPDINSSGAYFTAKDGKILYALGCLKSVGVKAMEEIIIIRNQCGKFKDIFDFVGSIGPKLINKRQFEQLIKAGAFDGLHPSRKQLFESIDLLLNYSTAIVKEKNSKQINLFGVLENCDKGKPPLAALSFWLKEELLNFEYEVFGFYPGEHPLQSYQEYFKALHIKSIKELQDHAQNGFSSVILAGVVLATKTRVSPKGRYVSALVSEPTGFYELSIFDEEIINDSRYLLEQRVPLLIKAEMKKDDGGLRLTASSITELDHVFKNKKATLQFKLTNHTHLAEIKALLEPKVNLGNAKVLIEIKADETKVLIELADSYLITPGVLAQARVLVGHDAINYSIV